MRFLPVQAVIALGVRKIATATQVRLRETPTELHKPARRTMVVDNIV